MYASILWVGRWLLTFPRFLHRLDVERLFVTALYIFLNSLDNNVPLFDSRLCIENVRLHYGRKFVLSI
jgi:hypothetical protein